MNNDFWVELKIDDQKEKQFVKYAKLIQEYNKVMNLTGIDDMDGIYLKHFYDSYKIIELIPKDVKSIADIGSGAGFPGIILAICLPDTKITLVEPLQKRCKFLEVVVNELGLDNVFISNERIEDIDYTFDLITMRAVAKMNIILELCSQVTGKYLLAMKGSNYKVELDESKKAQKVLGYEFEKIQEVILPIEESLHVNILFTKNYKTIKKYPRNFGQIKKNPL